jgi:23S rRNA pseudouridine2604 synthase
MCEYLGYEVTNLQRLRIMHIRLEKLAIGKWRYLSEVEMETLQESVSDSSGVPQKVKAQATITRKGKPVFEKKPFERKKDKKGEKKQVDRKAAKKGEKKSLDRKAEKKTSRAQTTKENSRKGRKEKSSDKSYKAFRDRGRKNN